MNTLTKYESTRVIGLRALEIQNGAQHLITINDETLRNDPIYVASLELYNGLLDFKINRCYPTNVVEQIHSQNYKCHNDVLVLLHNKENV